MLGLSALVGTASAETFTYGSYSVVNEVNVTISGSPSPSVPGFEDGYFGSGQIILNGTGADAGKYLDVWCIDATHILQWSDTYTVISSGFTNDGSASGGSLIGSPALGEIGALVNWGDQHINTYTDVSAAVQLAIWMIEYPGATFTSDSSAVNFWADKLVYDAEHFFIPDINLLEVVNPENPQGNQGLVFLDSQGQTIGLAPTPLPAALPLFATGLGAFGLLGWRRKRKGTLATS
jgi:hypothetical protein